MRISNCVRQESLLEQSERGGHTVAREEIVKDAHAGGGVLWRWM